jgi:hypothetical protein
MVVRDAVGVGSAPAEWFLTLNVAQPVTSAANDAGNTIQARRMLLTPPSSAHVDDPMKR